MSHGAVKRTAFAPCAPLDSRYRHSARGYLMTDSASPIWSARRRALPDQRIARGRWTLARAVLRASVPQSPSRSPRHILQLTQPDEEPFMSVAKIIEVTAESTESFESAIRTGIEETSKSLKNIEGAWVKEQKVVVNDGKIIGFRVDMKLTFVME
jgi:flavin-binding protein dodecin